MLTRNSSTFKSVISLLLLSSLVSAQQTLYGQCGGTGWTGATTCVSGSYCQYSNDWYSQCVPGTASGTSTSTTKTSTTTTKASTTSTSTGSASTSVRTSTPSGCLTVRGSGTKSGEYSTVAAALTALGSATTAQCIFIYSGTYTEQLVINYKGALTIYGYTTNTGSYGSNTVTITYGQTSSAAGSLDKSATVNITSANFKAYNINFVNSYGAGTQAVAVSANGDKQGYYGCSFKGYQDTLYAKSGKQYYSNCYIEGAVDYIFGDATAWFGECRIASNGAGYITAMSREVSTDTSWYVFDHSTITAASGVSVAGKVYLGRPWRVLARVIYQYCELTNVVNAAGWTTMAEGATPLYYEYQNTGDGASTSSRKYLTATNVVVTKDTVWGSDWRSWVDTSY